MNKFDKKWKLMYNINVNTTFGLPPVVAKSAPYLVLI